MANSKVPNYFKDLQEMYFEFICDKVDLNDNCALFVKKYTNELGDFCLNLNVYYKKDRTSINLGDIVYKSNSNLTEEETFFYDNKQIYICDTDQNVRSIFDLFLKSMYYPTPSNLSI